MLIEIKNRAFTNGIVYALKTEDKYLIETTDTFLPAYTKDAIGRKQNTLESTNVASRKERWMVGVSTMSGCPVRCKFCATANMKKCKNLSAEEIVQQVEFILAKNTEGFGDSFEHKINYTRMGEPFLNLNAVKQAIEEIDLKYPQTHHYVSTIGIKDSDFSWVKDNITLQISLHSLKEEKRNWLIPYKNKMSIAELGKIRTNSKLKTTINMTLVDEEDFDIKMLQECFNPDYFFIKLSPINKNTISTRNKLGDGLVKGINIV